MAYEMVMPYHLHMPSYFLETFTEYPYNKVEKVLREIIANDKRILTSPAPFIELGELAASSVNIKIRVWVNSSDYWNVFFSMNQTVYTIFNKEGINFPFPQLTVHQA